ncbi:2-polyprenyl-6-methoxyphenol hydroxylase-like FAD-dependent oxidoreductase [Chryseobacterium sp. SORGH_AS 447]|uniref:FAD-dependent oxidoreductase n=1 Tax=Chryseobacterium sp. SORGH_AS_0447 TaxID=3041769 RepID=UPI002787DB81|nr:NAD(P)/FAD-dependent oxidoreductase [Chryseobacterium sp. SORGH_AS_0447]MDQ1162407.1 2-polyprenyl-6-methoxyphenol hydroxylase-like FAD-dependent oxidoreductase [Chryseobacterium sp. SORGH_AS_0447]
MILENKQVAIIGGGPGGLTLARLLQMKGVDVTVYERDFSREARVQGSPLDLHENSGLAAIRKAGLLDVFKNSYMPGADRTTITDRLAQVVFTDHETDKNEDFGHEYFRPEIDRGTLRTILLDSLHPGTVVWDSHFLSMEPQGEGWLLHFKDRPEVYADLVIGADGARSKIRPSITGINAFYSGVTMLEGNIYEADKRVPEITDLLRGGKLMAFNDEKAILMGQKANGEIGFYASFKTGEHWITESQIDFSDNRQVLEWFKNEYKGWSDTWYSLFENTSLPFIPRPIYCMPLDQDWEALSNATIIGDAAHVMPPFAGEGVNMAMLDALELSENLTSDRYLSMPDAISTYENIMRKRASDAAKESLKNGEKMHSENALSDMTRFFSGL